MLGKIAQQIAGDIQRLSANAGTAGDQTVIKQIIERALRTMNLVTREEFDAQTAVLLRTREKLEALNKQLIALEQGITTPGENSAKALGDKNNAG